MEHRFVLVTFIFPGVPKMLDLEPAFASLGDDWIRISVTTWIVWTDKLPKEIFGKVRPKLDTNDQVFITKMDPIDCAGLLSPWIWSWMNSKIQNLITTGPQADNILTSFLLPSAGR